MQTSPANQKLKWVERISYLMDEQFRLPGTNYRFGLDPILNLIPILGDLSGFAVSGALILAMARYGASGKVLTLMIVNIVLDALIGAIPILGWVFDFAYKANTRNIRLLKEHYQEGKHSGSGKGILITIFVILLLLFIGLIYVVWLLIDWLAGYF